MTALNALLIHCEPLIKSIAQYRATDRHEQLEEIVSQIRVKLWRSLRLFDPARGTSFSFVARVISSVSASIVAEAWRRGERFVSLEEVRRQTMGENAYTLEDRELAPLQAPAGDRHATEHIEYLIRSIRTTCTAPEELAAQRWLVLSFLDCGFRLARHEVADACMAVFDVLTHRRARELHDATLIEIRRAVLGERRLVPIGPRDLARSRLAALAKLAPLLDAEQFTRLCVLLKDLAPAIIFLAKPQNTAAIRRGEPEPTRENLALVLNGNPNATPLFAP
jgi:hypothetical protein